MPSKSEEILKEEILISLNAKNIKAIAIMLFKSQFLVK